MRKLTRDDLYSLERYAEIRDEFRAKVLEHKKHRRVAVGGHVTLHFEDQLTILYQIQEMLRAQRIFDAHGIAEELTAYNPLIPSGDNWKATFMIEYEDPRESEQARARMKGIEGRIWVKVNDFDHVWAIADEDMEGQGQSQTSAVHFLRFQLTPAMAAAVKNGATVGVGIEHEAYCHQVDPLPDHVHESLAVDLD